MADESKEIDKDRAVFPVYYIGSKPTTADEKISTTLITESRHESDDGGSGSPSAPPFSTTLPGPLYTSYSTADSNYVQPEQKKSILLVIFVIRPKISWIIVFQFECFETFLPITGQNLSTSRM